MSFKKQNDKSTPNINFSAIITAMSVLSLFALFNFFVVANNPSDTSNNVVSLNIVFAQSNHPEMSNSTIIGNVIIPMNSNDTMTTAKVNASKNTNNTFIDKSAVAQNATSAVNFLKEPRTFPISPTGVSTEGLQQPPGHRILNNSNINSTQ